MKKGFSLLSLVLLAALVCIGSVPANAATANPSTGAAGYTPVVIPILGTYSGNRTGIVTWKAPANFQLIHASATARSSSGTNPTLKIRGSNNGFTNFSGSIAAGSVRDLKMSSTTAITDETNVSYDLVVGGTSPKWSDLTLFLFFKRK